MEEILSDIETDIGNALSKLLDIFGKSNSSFNDLNNEFISSPNNFDISKFRSRLKLFVKLEREYIVGITEDKKGNSSKEDLTYRVLRDLNFKHQKKWFETLINSKNKILIPFVIRNKPNFGQRWLYNRLVLSIKDLGKDYHKPILLNLSKPKILNLNSLFDFLLGDLSVQSDEIPKESSQKFRLLTMKIIERVETAYQIIILKDAFSFAQSNEFEDFFNKLIDLSKYLELIKKKGNKCIVIFTEETEEAYSCSSFCFLTEDSNLLSIQGEDQLKLIDLYTKSHITEDDLSDWFGTYYDDLVGSFEDYIRDKSKYNILIQDGNPENVIRNLCKQMNVNYNEKENQWLIH